MGSEARDRFIVGLTGKFIVKVCISCVEIFPLAGAIYELRSDVFPVKGAVRWVGAFAMKVGIEN